MIFKNGVHHNFNSLVIKFMHLISSGLIPRGLLQGVSKTSFLTIVFISSVTTHAYSSQVNYELWGNVLNTYVNAEGRVNYKGLKSNRGQLDNFIRNEIENQDIKTFSDPEKKAFWINAYNALTMRLIVDHYPLRFGGIRTINWGQPWNIKLKAAGRELTLGQIEHEILRKWDPIDPRIHFAINCASIGCPKIPNTYFNPDKLDEQLDHESRRFVNDSGKVRLDRSGNILYHSAIFNWFKEDFLSVCPDKLTFILKYLNERDRRYILANKNKIILKEMKYDWALNDAF